MGHGGVCNQPPACSMGLGVRVACIQMLQLIETLKTCVIASKVVSQQGSNRQHKQFIV